MSINQWLRLSAFTKVIPEDALAQDFNIWNLNYLEEVLDVSSGSRDQRSRLRWAQRGGNM